MWHLQEQRGAGQHAIHIRLGGRRQIDRHLRQCQLAFRAAEEVVSVLGAAPDDQALAQAPYDVLADWQDDYEGNLRVILPDTFGTHGFLETAPDWVAQWTGVRIDSGDPFAGGEAAIDWWRARGQDPRTKLAIFSDGLDVELIEALHAHFHDRIRLGFGWGTMLTNDFRKLDARGRLDPFSIVCKVISADGKPAVKLSDNPTKAVGPTDAIQRYRRVFRVGEQAAQPVVV